METIQEICGANGYNYNSNHSLIYRDINNSIKSGTKVILQKRGVVNTHLGKPYNLTVKVGSQTIREFYPTPMLLDRKKLGKIIQKNIATLTKKNLR